MKSELDAILDLQNLGATARRVKKNPKLLAWLVSHTAFLPETCSISQRLYHIVNTVATNKCSKGQTKKFLSFERGYGFCGKQSVCECCRQSVTEKVSSAWQNMPNIRKAEIAAARAATNLEVRGVENPSQCKQVRAQKSQWWENLSQQQLDEIACKRIAGYRESLGVNNPQQCSKVKAKTKQTNIARYGVPNPAQAESTKLRAQETNNRKYGTNSYSQTKEFKDRLAEAWKNKSSQEKAEIQERIKQTNLDRHGVEHPSQLPQTAQKAAETSLLRYGVINHSQKHYTNQQKSILFDSTAFVNYSTGKTISEIAAGLNIDPTTASMYIQRHNAESVIIRNHTWLENQVKSHLNYHGISFYQNDRKILSGLELDFYLPDHQIAFELNGLYWHSHHKIQDKNYHFRKWKACRDQGIDLYQWFEDDVRDCWPVIESKIEYLAGVEKPRIGARKCDLREVTYQTARPLLEANHIQGGVNGQQYILGAYYGDQLVGVMGFAHRKHYLELTRFATDLSNTYPGLFSRMLKYSLNDLAYVGDVVSFSDNCHSNGAVYAANGFEIDKILGPAYWYTSDYQTRHNRQGFMKSKIARRFGVDMSNKTEWEAMRELGWDRVWDAGKIKWLKPMK